MANNVYVYDDKKLQYRLPGWELVERRESDSGLALQVYKSTGKHRPKTLVIAYEGTNNGARWWRDWRANLAITEPVQYSEAMRHLRETKEKFAGEVEKIVVTGLSLGGAIALNMANREPGISAAVFNSSPHGHIKVGWFSREVSNPRVSFSEKGEGLWIFNGYNYFRNGILPRDSNYIANTYNYLDFRWFTASPMKEHSIYALSRGLLLAAVHAGSDEADAIWEENFPEPHVHYPLSNTSPPPPLTYSRNCRSPRP